jgi:hypothetical protein
VSEQINPIIDVARLVAAGIVGGLVATFAAHKLAASRDRRIGINADKKTYCALIHGLIESAKACDTPNSVRCEIRRTLYQSHARFRENIAGKRLIAYDKAWDNLRNTTPEEMGGNFFDLNSPELKKVQQLLIGRFEALRKIIKET